jgi:hypothetical protein
MDFLFDNINKSERICLFLVKGRFTKTATDFDVWLRNISNAVTLGEVTSWALFYLIHMVSFDVTHTRTLQKRLR